MFTSHDLRIVLQLATRASLPVGETVQLLPILQRIDEAVKLNATFVPQQSQADDGPDVGKSPGGTA